MMLLCQLCGSRNEFWLVTQAIFKVGEIDWKISICPKCHKAFEDVVIEVKKARQEKV